MSSQTYFCIIIKSPMMNYDRAQKLFLNFTPILTLSCITFFYHIHKPDNHVKQSIKYTNFKKGASKFLLNLKTTLFACKPPLQNINLFSEMHLKNSKIEIYVSHTESAILNF